MNIEATLMERAKTHGSFTMHAKASQGLKEILHFHEYNWHSLSDVQKEALEMIVHKIARIIVGNPNELDHWHDIAGYAKLAEESLNAKV